VIFSEGEEMSEDGRVGKGEERGKLSRSMAGDVGGK
jgi:hypothetical protein